MDLDRRFELGKERQTPNEDPKEAQKLHVIKQDTPIIGTEEDVFALIKKSVSLYESAITISYGVVYVF